MKKIAGDYAAKLNNQSKGTNIGGFLHKTMRLAGSGLYTYHRSEASTLGLDMSGIPEDQMTFNVYRPAEVLKEHKDMFARVPIIIGNHLPVTTANAKQHAVGLIGDNIDCEVSKDDGELYLYGTATIIAGDGVEMYKQHGQVSVGYVPTVEWSKGEYKGVAYDAVLKNFNDVNHVTICEKARGGPQCMVMDSLDGSPLSDHKNNSGGMKMLKNLFNRAQKAPSNGDGRVPVLLQSIAIGADPKTQVDAILAITGDSIKDETWTEYLGDLAQCAEETPEVKAAAVAVVTSHYNKICGDAAPEKDDGAKDADKEPKKNSTGKEDKSDDDDDDTSKPKDDPKPTAGDALAPVLAMMTEMQKTVTTLAGDMAALKEVKKEEPVVDTAAVGQLSVLLTGDTAKPKAVTSQALLDNIIGGN